MTAPDICHTCRCHAVCKMQSVCRRVKQYRVRQEDVNLSPYIDDRYWQVRRQKRDSKFGRQFD